MKLRITASDIRIGFHHSPNNLGKKITKKHGTVVSKQSTYLTKWCQCTMRTTYEHKIAAHELRLQIVKI